jgi:NADH dehydrogenase
VRKVVIVGGGFGGLTAARKLRGADVEVTLVDKMHHHLFQPLLYQVACGSLSTGECASPIRSGLKHSSNATVLMAEATGVDVERRQLLLDRGERLDYDSLIVSCGAETSYFGKDDWQDASYGMKTLSDAVELRNRIYGCFEEAERCEDPVERERWMTFVVIGGGPTGVEIAGELSIVAAHTMKREFTRIQPSDARVILLDAGERVAASFSEKLSGKVANELASLGVSVHVGARVSDIDAHGVIVSIAGVDTRFEAWTVIWAAGVQPVPFVKALAEATGAPTDHAGRIQIEDDLTLPGHPEISAIGDIASLAGPDKQPLPGLATVAIQQARHVAKAIGEGGAGASTPFRYLDKGALAVVGRGKAVCEIRGLEFSGRAAFFLYLTIHMYYLSGGGQGRRLKVLLDWVSARMGRPQNPVINSDLDSVERLPRGARL